MKKVTSIILCTFLLICLTSCGEQTESEDLLTEDDVKSTTSLSEAFNYSFTEGYNTGFKEGVSSQSVKQNEETDNHKKEAIYYKAKDYYLNSDWDGYPTILDGHTIELSRSSGEILIDGYLVHQENLDLPEDLDTTAFDSNLWYVPYFGNAVIQDQVLKIYRKGELFTLPGGELVYDGIDLNHYTPISYFLRPYEEYNKLFLLVTAVPNDVLDEYGIEYLNELVGEGFPLYYSEWNDTDTPLADAKRYLYVFPNSTASKVELVSEVKDWMIWQSSGSPEEWSYTDVSGIKWKYQNSLENYGFVQTKSSTLN